MDLTRSALVVVAITGIWSCGGCGFEPVDEDGGVQDGGSSASSGGSSGGVAGGSSGGVAGGSSGGAAGGSSGGVAGGSSGGVAGGSSGGVAGGSSGGVAGGSSGGVAGGSSGGVAGGSSGGLAGGGTAGGSVGSPGCADGTREGLMNAALFPNVAACEGAWSGWIDEPSAGSLCATDWHVCRGTDLAVGTVTFQQATSFLGCFAFDTAHDCNACYPTCRGSIGMCRACCIPNTPIDPDMGGIGANCLQLPIGTGASCLATGRVDSSQNSTGCQWNPMITGVACCRN